MLFCSEQFLFFFLLVFFTYWALPYHRARVYLLLCASFYFYACWSPQLALLIVVSTTIDFFLARGIEASTSPRRRKFLLSINVAGNLGLLCYFKYANFFLDSLREAFHAAGWSASWGTLGVIIPVGISFYTFEAISYMVDVYRGRIRAERNLAHFQLFILFFPHLVAGPIVRGRDFLPQVRQRKRFSWLRLELGVRLFLLGLVKKLAVADRMAEFADPVFANPEVFRTSMLWLAVLAYALQVYCDFSGYSDMALGCAHLLGYKLVKNFDMPYLSLNITEFWRRWHISLGSWLRDYVFIPLEGSRVPPWKVYRNLMITMFLCGLWHGPSWHFVGWGVLNGVLLSLHRGFHGFCERRPVLQRVFQSLPGTLARWALTFLSVCLGYVVFRTLTYQGTAAFLTGLVVPRGGERLSRADIGVWLTILAVVLAHAATASGLLEKGFRRMPSPAVGLAYSLALTLALLLAPMAGQAFIYFQF